VHTIKKKPDQNKSRLRNVEHLLTSGRYLLHGYVELIFSVKINPKGHPQTIGLSFQIGDKIVISESTTDL
jgi:hypothetical protein